MKMVLAMYFTKGQKLVVDIFGNLEMSVIYYNIFY